MERDSDRRTPVTEMDTPLRYLMERFGIPEGVLLRWRYVENRKSVWLTSVDEETLQEASGFKRLEFIGVRLLRKIKPSRDGKVHFKPTSYGLQLIGQWATRNVIDIERSQLLTLLKEGTIRIQPDGVENGFVIIRYRSCVLGCGLYKDGLLRHQFPKTRAEVLANSGLF